MDKYSVRINDVRIINFMNIRKGMLSFSRENSDRPGSILGLYGQNGSGKTALVNAFSILKYVLSGEQVPQAFASCIKKDSESSSFTYSFLLRKDEEFSVEVIYSFSIKGIDSPDGRGTKKSVMVYDEILKTRLYKEKDERIGRIIDTSESVLITPVSKKNLLFGNDKDNELNKILYDTRENSRSFIFSDDTLSLIEKRAAETGDDSAHHYFSLLSSLSQYGRNYFFVINTTNNALVSMNAQPLNFKIGEGGGTIAVPIDGEAEIPTASLDLVRNILLNVNIVLGTIIPGLCVSLDAHETRYDEKGESITYIEIMSERNGTRIPFSNESEGIKKLVSIVNLFANVMTDSTVTVVIDELDTSIFEYLLGELLSIISGAGFGQLIFTAHNLRPLETLDKGCVAFTTTDPDNRFIRLRNIKGSHNLRDTYYRSIFLGVPYNNLYDRTNNSDIELALFEAGGLGEK